MNNALVTVMKEHSLAVVYLLSTLVLFLICCQWRFLSVLVQFSCQRITSAVQQSILQFTVTLLLCLPFRHRVSTLCAGHSAATCTGAVRLKCSWKLLQLTCASAKEILILLGLFQILENLKEFMKNVLQPCGGEKRIQKVISVYQWIQMTLVTWKSKQGRHQKCCSLSCLWLRAGCFLWPSSAHGI